MLTVEERAAQLRSRLHEGDVLLGGFLSLGTALTAEIMGAAGYEFALVDLEHGSGSEQDALAQIQALAATDCVSLVRVESTSRQRVHRVLDFGAHGVMFPRIESAEEAAAAVAAMRYPPSGTRGGASVTRACAFGANFRPYFAASSDLLTIVQIESPEAVDRAADIAAVDGVDVLFLGPFDLSLAMGILGEFDHPRFLEACARTAQAACAHGKQAGILLPAGHTIQKYVGLGYRFIAAGSDAMLLQQAARALVASLREQRSALPA